MPATTFRYKLLKRKLGKEGEIWEAFRFPEMSSFVESKAGAIRTREALAGLERWLNAGLQNGLGREIHHRAVAEGEGRAFVVEIAEAGPRHLVSEPVTVCVHGFVWHPDEKSTIAFVPALGIEVLAEGKKAIEDRVVVEVRATLSRRHGNRLLLPLAHLERETGLSVEERNLKVELRTVLEKLKAGGTERASLLSQVSEALRPGPTIHGVDDDLERLVDLFGLSPPRSVLLVGPSGVGKTARLRMLAKKHETLGLKDLRIRRTSGVELISAGAGYGMWQKVCERLVEEIGESKETIVLAVGSLLELMRVGRSDSNDDGIASYLRRFISRGQIAIAAECTPEQVSVIEREDPALLRELARVDVEEPSEEVAREILLESTPTRQRPDRTVLDEAIALTVRLHRRYAAHSALPGRALRFFDAIPKRDSRSVYHAFSEETGLPIELVDPSSPMDLEKVRDFFDSRVMGQPAARDLVVDLLATIRAGLQQPGRPIASLLFVGPTGVGKTEMAKALSSFVYSDSSRLLRFDMGEYSDPVAASRLVGVGFGAEGALTSKIRERPFTVLLLDEIEKADPRVFDLLLQVLGEGRLTDAGGRLASFENAIVIMTSNIGARAFHERTAGFGTEDAAGARPLNAALGEVRDFFRPELFNRIDRIVPFGTLDREIVGRIALREIEKASRREGFLGTRISLETSGDVVERLVDRGFQPGYGARPLKREIESELLVPTAEILSGGRAARESVLSAVLSEGEIEVCTTRGESTATRQAQKLSVDIADCLSRLRRRVLAGGESAVYYKLQSLIEQERRRKKKETRKGYDTTSFEKLNALNGRFAVLKEKVSEMEEDLMVELLSKGRVTRDNGASLYESLSRDWREVQLDILNAVRPGANEVVVAIYAESAEALKIVSTMYAALGKKQGYEANFSLYSIEASSKRKEAGFARMGGVYTRPPGFPKLARACMIAFSGRGARLFFEGEGGRYQLQGKGGVSEDLQARLASGQTNVQPDSRFARKKGMGEGQARRKYDLERGVITGKELPGGRMTFSGNLGPSDAVHSLLTHRFERRLELEFLR